MADNPVITELITLLTQIEKAPEPGLITRARTLFQISLRADPENWALNNAYTNFLISQNEDAVAVEFWCTIAATAPDLEPLHRGVEILVKLYRTDAALTLIDRADRDISAHEALLCRKAELLIGAGRPWAGFNTAMATLRLNGDNPAALSLAVEAAFLLGHYESAFVLGRYKEVKDRYFALLKDRPDGEKISRVALGLNELPEFDGPQLTAWIREMLTSLPKGEVVSDFSKRDWSADRPLRLGVLSLEAGGSELGQYQCFPAMRSLNAHPGLILKVFDAKGIRQPYWERWQQAGIEIEDVSDLNTPQLIDRITRFVPDVILDVTGHTAYPMGMMLRYRLAPVQMTLYFSALAVEELDAAIYSPDTADASEAGEGPLGVKTLIDLPVYAPYLPASDDIALSPSPVGRNGAVTFGCFNHIGKINADVLNAWARILEELPTARLVIKAYGLEEKTYEPVFKERLRQAGIDLSRIELFGFLPEPLYVKIHDMVDILLDTFPFNGASTSLRAVWHGVPVITKTGVLPYARMGEEILNRVGLNACIARSAEEYIAASVALARQPERLSELRKQVYHAARSSDYTRPDLYADALEAAMRRLWKAAPARFGQ